MGYGSTVLLGSAAPPRDMHAGAIQKLELHGVSSGVTPPGAGQAGTEIGEHLCNSIVLACLQLFASSNRSCQRLHSPGARAHCLGHRQCPTRPSLAWE